MCNALPHRTHAMRNLFKTYRDTEIGHGTRDAIAALHILYERNLEYYNKVYVCYVDYEKAFDREDWTKLMTILNNIGVNWRDRKLIWNLYNKQVAYV